MGGMVGEGLRMGRFCCKYKYKYNMWMRWLGLFEEHWYHCKYKYKYSKTNTNTINGFDDWGKFEDGPIPLQIQVEIQYVYLTVGDCKRKAGFIANTKKDTNTNRNTIGGWDDWVRFEEGPLLVQEALLDRRGKPYHCLAAS